MAGRKSKKQKILDEALQHKEFERMRIIEILKSLGKFTPALNPLIEMYLDACEVYHIKYLEWKDSGFKSTKVHTNKNGSRNEIKHYLHKKSRIPPTVIHILDTNIILWRKGIGEIRKIRCTKRKRWVYKI